MQTFKPTGRSSIHLPREINKKLNLYSYPKKKFYRTTLGGGGPLAYPSFVLISPDATSWVIKVSTGGNLNSSVRVNNPDGSYISTGLTLVDSSNNPWSVTINNSGNLITTSGASPVGSLKYLDLRDINGRIWKVTVSTSGNLVTT